MAHIAAMKAGFAAKKGAGHMSFLVKKDQKVNFENKKKKQREKTELEKNFEKSVLMGKKLFNENQRLMKEISMYKDLETKFNTLKTEYNNLIQVNEELEEAINKSKLVVQEKEMKIEEIQKRVGDFEHLKKQHERVLENNSGLRKKQKELEKKVKQYVHEKEMKEESERFGLPEREVVTQVKDSKAIKKRVKQLEKMLEQTESALRMNQSQKEKEVLEYEMKIKRIENQYKRKIMQDEARFSQELKEKDEKIQKLQTDCSEFQKVVNIADHLKGKERQMMMYIEELFQKLRFPEI